MALKKLKIEQNLNRDKPNIVDEPILMKIARPEIPQLNLVVTTNIAKYADFETLKTMRQISIIWNEGSTQKFKKRCHVVLRIEENVENDLNMKRFKESTKKLQPIKNIRIEFSPPGLAKQQSAQRKVKIVNNILRFVTPTLECLKISGNFFPQSSIKFPKLVKLVLLNIHTSKNYPPMSFKNTPNLRELNVLNLVLFDCEDFAFPSLLNANGSRNHSILPKLEALNLKSPYNMKFLSTFTQTWSKLDLYCSTDVIKYLERLLKEQNLNLNSLTLRIFSEFFPKSQAVELKFPIFFPNLKKLAISFKSLECPHFKIRFGEEELNYSKTLPTIKTLGIYCTELQKNNMVNIWKTFFPKQICTTLTFFEMDLDNLYSNVLCGKEDEKWYNAFFPNAQAENIQTTLTCY